jgi:hypothetical protein
VPTVAFWIRNCSYKSPHAWRRLLHPTKWKLHILWRFRS